MLLRLLITMILVLLVPPTCFDCLWMRGNGWSWKRIMLWLPFLLILAIGIGIVTIWKYTPQNACATGAFFIAFLAVGIPSCILAIFALISRIFKNNLYRKSIMALGLTIGAIIFAIIMIGYFYGSRKLVVKHTEIALHNIPEAFNGYTIVQFSDLHLGTYGRHRDNVERLVRAINAEKPNLIVFTGDIVNYNIDELKPFCSILGQISAPDGVFSVMGNHDYLCYQRWKTKHDQLNAIHQLQQDERDMGWNLLLNSHAIITHNGDSIAIIGVENDGRPPFPQFGDLRKAQKGLPDVCASGSPMMKILLSHDPTHWQRRVLPETDIQLTLSGHTHGTQCSIFGWSPAQLLYKEWGGLYEKAGRYLYVSTGIGQVLIPFRFGIWPQIETITLKKQ